MTRTAIQTREAARRYAPAIAFLLAVSVVMLAVKITTVDYAGPGDIVPQLNLFYGLRAFSHNYAIHRGIVAVVRVKATNASIPIRDEPWGDADYPEACRNDGCTIEELVNQVDATRDNLYQPTAEWQHIFPPQHRPLR